MEIQVRCTDEIRECILLLTRAWEQCAKLNAPYDIVNGALFSAWCCFVRCVNETRT